ncbi:FAD-binding oxidoreductase [Lasiodiplodia theobromae]|uniref:FAD-binding oxidoreductase n=1 Tax=Lasiodiplodia theobromae TaxID=45133 RepID=UPI0015C345B5|nr:FAD-binding oxidoreductase [Lasiodiplodia theobromae]KAF4540637.1 FAD-binding oxidoreductase [Lasiodiplodia theobromae]
MNMSRLLVTLFVTGCMAHQSLIRSASDPSAACHALNDAYPAQVLFPSAPNYTVEADAIWNQAGWFDPTCIFVPETAAILADGVRTLSQSKTPFAVRSGGHMPVAGHQSIQQGVMIAMTHFIEKTTVSEPNEFGTSYLRAGAAFRWIDIYAFLEERGLLAAGGRVSSVGSSLLLGGGLSYFSGTRGWAANQVVNFEVVTADGQILQANANEHADLFWALKGGSNNFGIVTRYDLKTFPTSQMYGGTVTWASEDTQKYLDAQTAFILPGGGADDPNAAIMPNFGFDPLTNLTNAGTVLVYAGPDPNPKALENFTAIPTTFSTVAVQNFTSIVESTSGYSPRDRRWSFYNTAVLASADTMDLLYRHVVKNAQQILPGVNCSVGAAVQPITTLIQQAARDNGGDALNLDPNGGSFVVALIYGNWFDPAYDVKIKEWTDATLSSIEAETKAKGLYHPFKFLNDAGITQNPISTYGNGSSLPRMKAVSDKYDPDGVFQTLVPGFKLGRELHFWN